MVQWFGLQYVIVVFLDCTHLPFGTGMCIVSVNGSKSIYKYNMDCISV